MQKSSLFCLKNGQPKEMEDFEMKKEFYLYVNGQKEKSTEKIDDAIATIMALDRAIRCGNQNTESLYDSRGILFM